MPRIRSVSPDICVSETMAGIPAELERTFVRLWTHCDDEGRALDNVRLIKAAIYPLDDEMTVELLDEQLGFLAEHGLVVRYETGDKRYIAVVSWEEYQHPQRPTPSKYPAPPVVLPEPSRKPPRAGTEDSRSGGEKEREREGSMAPALPTRIGTRTTPRARAPDPTWDALLAVCGVTEVTESARGRYNRAAKELRALDVTPEDIAQHGMIFRQRWPEASLTPSALASRWGETDPDRQHAPVAPRDSARDILRASAERGG